MNVYLIVSKKGDEYRVVANAGSTVDINSDTMVFVTPAFAFSTIEQLKQQWPDREFDVYQLAERPEAGGDAILWKISEHDTTAVSYVITGVKDGKKLYHTTSTSVLVDRLVDAYRFHSLNAAASTMWGIDKTAKENPASIWHGIEDLHVEHVLEDLVSVDIRQEPLKIKCNMKD